MLSAYRGNSAAASPSTSGKAILVSVNLGADTIADGTTFTPNATNTLQEMANTQAIGTLTIAAPSGAAADGMRIIMRIRSTNVQTFSWAAIYRGSTDLALPTSTSGATLYDYLAFMYNAAAIKWDLLGKNFGF